MDPQLPAQIVQFLAPYLPYLLKGVKLAGQEAAKKLGEKAGEQGFEQAKACGTNCAPRWKPDPPRLRPPRTLPPILTTKTLWPPCACN